jgi:hypothetical protein
MEFSCELKKSYIPEFNGNRDLDETAQVSVEWDELSESSIRTIRPKRDVAHKYDSKGTYVGMDMHYETDEFLLISGFNPRIKNLSWKDRDGKTRKVTNATTLFEAPAPLSGKLIKELIREFQKEIRVAEEDTPEDEKKSG